jgi:hypothetical protein
MAYNSKFGPGAQTPAQRAWVLKQMQECFPNLKRRVTAYTQLCYGCYVTGELSWSEMRQVLLTGQG